MTIDRILLVDDEADLLTGLQRTLERGVKKTGIIITTSAKEAIELIQKDSFDLAMLDIKMVEMSGLDLLEELKKHDPSLTVVMMTAFASIEVAVEAMRRGAYDFITKPFDKDALFRIVNKGLERNRLMRENITLRERVCQKEAVAGFIGQSANMRHFLERLKTIALSNYTVLVRGESGTGKELTARAIHNLSKRRNHSLIMVNCPAIPEHLLESELFGHKRGAFTGADRDHKGLFEEAQGGTICLDEIGDIPVNIQTKLLRVLQEQEIKPIGANKTIKVDVRIIAMTNQNLEAKIKERSFREDLFYRLNVVTIKTPPLDELREDIPLLVGHFSQEVSCELAHEEKQFTPEAIELLQKRNWPGNVRELQNIVRQAIMFCPDKNITAEMIADSSPATPKEQALEISQAFNLVETMPYKDAKELVLQDFSNAYITKLLESTNGNVTKAAELSGLTRAALQKIMRRTSIKSSAFRLQDD